MGTFLLCRALGNGRAPSLVGGLAFGFGTYLISWLDHPHTNAYILLPWLFLAGWRLCRKGRPIDAAALGGVTGLVFLGGHPQSAMIVSLPTVAWVTYRLFAEDLSASPVKRRAALAIGAGGLGLALGSVMLLPFVEALRNSYEASRGGPALDVQAGISFLFPDYWNRPDRSYVVGGPANFSERTAYFGALPILLAVGGLAARRPRGPEAFFALLALVALAVAFDSGPSPRRCAACHFSVRPAQQNAGAGGLLRLGACRVRLAAAADRNRARAATDRPGRGGARARSGPRLARGAPR